MTHGPVPAVVPATESMRPTVDPPAATVLEAVSVVHEIAFEPTTGPYRPVIAITEVAFAVVAFIVGALTFDDAVTTVAEIVFEPDTAP
jgi:sporulation-control protein spo0M